MFTHVGSIFCLLHEFTGSEVESTQALYRLYRRILYILQDEVSLKCDVFFMLNPMLAGIELEHQQP